MPRRRRRIEHPGQHVLLGSDKVRPRRHKAPGEFRSGFRLPLLAAMSFGGGASNRKRTNRSDPSRKTVDALTNPPVLATTVRAHFILLPMFSPIMESGTFLSGEGDEHVACADAHERG
jgi:hypothetical protein